MKYDPYADTEAEGLTFVEIAGTVVIAGTVMILSGAAGIIAAARERFAQNIHHDILHMKRLGAAVRAKFISLF